MDTIILKIFLCILFILISPFQSSAFDIPERLHYEITWAGIIEVNEGDAKFNKEIISNYKTKSVTYIDHLNKERIVLNFKNLAPDPLSSLYYIRKLPLKVGGSYPITVFNSKKLNTFYIHVLGNDTVKIPLGTFKTILIKLNMNLEGEGIFFAPGELFIWLTDDKKKRPVMIRKVIPQLSVERENIFKKMPDFIKRQLKGNIDTITAKLTKYS